jgi:4-amino-4-deoxy-L-arabinose transferase-like glycosyltransferase
MPVISSSVLQYPDSIWKAWLEKSFYWLLVSAIVVSGSGLLLPILEPDGALYAMISKTMVLSGDYINLRVEGLDWLDKPHFPFWIVAFSFHIFGINSFAYKFPAFLFWLTGAWYTHAFAKRIYDSDAADLAVLIYISAEHLILSNNDVRAEPYLTGLLVASVYYFYLVYKENKSWYIIPASLFAATAVMTKGIFVLVFVCIGFGLEWAVKKKWDEFLKFRWWLSILLILFFISPELYSLYTQFDLHPEKVIFHQTNVSGIWFFFLDSQFGRFFNSGPITGSGDYFFYFHTILWTFLPWSLFAILLAFSKLKYRLFNSYSDFVCSGIFMSGFIIFSLSKFQLPHYLNILYPFLSILVAGYFVRQNSSPRHKIIFTVQNIICIMIIIFCIILTFFFDPPYQWLVIAFLFISGAGIYLIYPGNPWTAIFGRSFLVSMIFNLYINTIIYPVLFQYESGKSAAAYLEKNKFTGTIYTFKDLDSEYALEFYSSMTVRLLNPRDCRNLKDSTLVLAPAYRLDSLKLAGIPIRNIQAFPYSHISQPSLNFLNKKTRNETADMHILAWIVPEKTGLR